MARPRRAGVVLAALLLLAACAGQPARAQGVNGTIVKAGGQDVPTFYLHCDPDADWNHYTAQQWCSNNVPGGSLAVIRSAAESSALATAYRNTCGGERAKRVAPASSRARLRQTDDISPLK